MPGLFDLANESGSPVATFNRNLPYVSPSASSGPFNTNLPFLHEMAFRDWVKQNNVPFDPNAAQSDYDMRGFFQGLMQNNPRASSSVNSNDSQLHYPDYWKTPYHNTFSEESQWAGPVAPKWAPDDKLVAPNGRILFDERSQR